MTLVFWVKVAEQVPGQLIPAGLLVIVPVPEVGAVTVKANDCIDPPPELLLGEPPQLASSRADTTHRDAKQNFDRELMAQNTP